MGEWGEGGKEYGNLNNEWGRKEWRRCLQAVYNYTDI